jgi:hypothetical protein
VTRPLSPAADPRPLDDALARIFDDFAVDCRGYSRMAEEASATVARSTELLAFVRSTPPMSHHPTLLLNAVHYLVIQGTDHELAAVYHGDSRAELAPVFTDFVLSHQDELRTIMSTRNTQTNEVLRSGFLAVALTWAEREHGHPLGWIDVGASGGLNLGLDHFRIEVGTRAVGATDARPLIRVDATGDVPLGPSPAAIAWRAGLDREPIDVSDPSQARWLEACLWPDQPARLTRLRDAIAIAAAHPPRLVRGDAVDDLPRLLAEIPDECLACVTTTWAFVYLPPDRRVAFEAVLRDAGRTVVWLSAEATDVVPGLAPGEPPERPAPRGNVLGAVTYRPGSDAERRALGWVHPHGEWLSWDPR